MAKKRTVLSDSLINTEHAQLASAHAEKWGQQWNERLETHYPLTQLRPSQANPRRPSLDRAGVTLERIQELAIRPTEDAKTWVDRMLAWIKTLEADNPSGAEVWDFLLSLALSVRNVGLLQPIVVNEDGEIVAGERRWIASLLGGVGSGRVLIRSLDAVLAAKARFIENMQRQDLSLDEEVRSLRDVVSIIYQMPCGPDIPVTIRDCQELMGRGQTQSWLYRVFCQLPDGDPVLQSVYDRILTRKDRAMALARDRVEQLRREAANRLNGVTPENTEAATDLPAHSPDPIPEKPKTRSSIKMCLPGTHSGQRFLTAVTTIAELSDQSRAVIDASLAQWAEAPEKRRKQLMADVLTVIFEDMASLDDDEQADGEE